MSITSNCTSCGTSLKQDAKFCSNCGSPTKLTSTNTTSIPSVSKTVKHPMSKKAKVIYTLAAVGLFAVLLFTYMSHLPGGEHPIISQQPEVMMASLTTGHAITSEPINATVEDGTISFPLASLREKRMVEFDYRTEIGTVPLLAFISSEGKLVTAIRMCEPCNSKSFRIEGDELACGNCETRWKLNNLEGIQGSCQKYPPDPIPSEVRGNRVVINESLVKNWKMRI